MKPLLKKLYRIFLRKLYRKIRLIYNQLGSKKECYVCNRTFNNFIKYRGGSKAIPSWLSKLEIVGSDFDNFGCPFCFSHDRERHLFMFFDKLSLWDKTKNFRILHFAPETNLSNKLLLNSPIKYIKADLNPNDKSINKIDATDIPFENNYFDIVICNHVLEHIIEYKKALKEIYRVLRPNGFAILQTPYSRVLCNNIEDEGFNTDELRKIYYGQEDHVRIFSKKQFIQSLADNGFIVDIIRHKDTFSVGDSQYFGVNSLEDLIKVSKPNVMSSII